MKAMPTQCDIDEAIIWTMTVADLMVLLRGFPQNAKVISEGCDCYGPVRAVDERAGVVVLTR